MTTATARSTTPPPTTTRRTLAHLLGQPWSGVAILLAFYIGLIVVFSALGGTLGSFITGRLFVAFDGTTAFGLLLLPVAALAVSLTRLRRHLSS